GKPVLYVTDRCVFRLTPAGLELIEIAPDADLKRDILALMDFEPIIRIDPTIMDDRIFRPEPMGLESELLTVPLPARSAPCRRLPRCRRPPLAAVLRGCHSLQHQRVPAAQARRHARRSRCGTTRVREPLGGAQLAQSVAATTKS